jgi:hypothetical protein
MSIAAGLDPYGITINGCKNTKNITVQRKIILPLMNTAATSLREVPTSIMSNEESIIKKRKLYYHWFISPIPHNSVKRLAGGGIAKNEYVKSLL